MGWDKENDRLLKSATKMLEKLGWRVLVIGGLRIEQRLTSEYHYRLTIDFTGGKPKKFDSAVP